MNLPVNEIVQGDVVDVLQELPDDSVDCVVTSPPYWGLRDYQIDGQLGVEEKAREYVDNRRGNLRRAAPRTRRLALAQSRGHV